MPQDLEALWSIRFGAMYPTATVPATYESAGVVVLETGKLFGGDTGIHEERDAHESSNETRPLRVARPRGGVGDS
jgi:hypothetical protein